MILKDVFPVWRYLICRVDTHEGVYFFTIHVCYLILGLLMQLLFLYLLHGS